LYEPPRTGNSKDLETKDLLEGKEEGHHKGAGEISISSFEEKLGNINPFLEFLKKENTEGESYKEH